MPKYCVDCKYCDTVDGVYCTCSMVLDLVTKLPMDCRKLRETTCGAEGRLFEPEESDSVSIDTAEFWSDIDREHSAADDEEWGDQ